MRRFAAAAVAALLIVGTTACATDSDQKTETKDTKESHGATRGPSATVPASPKPRPGSLQTLSKDDTRVKDAVQELSKRASVKEEEIEIAEVLKVTWPDSSLGCPQKGKKYTQAVVPGERLLLRAGEKQYSYHAAEGKPYEFCANPGKALPATAAKN